ncbi:MAG: helix-turn-helix transcriptional regulator [Lachnospiraceae bacterium]|nr:helix-turn-helix transcriptional regulator [Lachnospiraceae bacterium]
MEFENLDGYQLAHAQRNPSAAILREQRVTQNMTQVQVAAKAEITLQQYQKFENGSRNIRTASFQLACRVLKALNMDIDRFFTGDYALGEEIYAEDGKLKYKKTGRDIRDDVEESEEAE